MNAGADLEAADEIECWRRAELGAGAQVVDALVRRRAAEKAHFLGLPEGFSKSPRAVLRPLPGADGQGWETPPPPVEAAGSSATLNAANSVQARLRELVPEPGARSFPAPDASPAAAETTQAVREQESDPGPGPLEAASSEELAARPSVGPQPKVETAPPTEPGALPPRGVAAYVAPPPPPPASNLAAHAANDATPPADRPPQPPSKPDTMPETAAAAASSARTPRDAARPPTLTARRVYAALAAFGACLFVAAAALILGGRPTLANLVLGVCGVGLMTPGVYGLLGPRPPEG
jgi:lysozyme